MGKGNVISVIVSVTFVGLVLGLSFDNEPALAGIGPFPPPSGDLCDSETGVLQHWDKIIFETDRRLITGFAPPPSPLTILPILTYDIKVQQDPFSVTNLERTVSDFLNANGYTTTGKGKVRPLMIDIVDVEYEIACASIFVTI